MDTERDHCRDCGSPDIVSFQKHDLVCVECATCGFVEYVEPKGEQGNHIFCEA